MDNFFLVRRQFFKKKRLFLFLFFSLILLSFSLWANQKSRFDIILLNPLEEKSPGETVLLRFFLQNLSFQHQRFTLRYFWPEDWTFLGKEAEVALSPSEKTLFIAPFYIPRKTKAGERTIKIEVASKENPSLRLEKEVKIKVKSQIEVELKAESLSLLAKAGEDVIFPFYIHNQSNLPLRLSLKPETNFAWPISLETETLFLESGEVRQFKVGVKTKRNLTSKCTLHLFLTAISENADPPVKLTAYSTAIIFPESMAKETKKAFPLSLSFLSLLQEKATFAQANLQLRLSRNQHQKLDLYLRGPAQEEFRLFGYFPDEYRFLYSQTTWSIYLGDKIYSLSRLTNFGEYGRGMELVSKFNWAEIKTSLYQPLFQEKNNGNPLSLKLNFFPQKKIRFSFNFFEKKDKEKRNIILYSLESQVKTQNIQAELELALSKAHQNLPSSAGGLWFEALTNLKNLKVKAIYLATKPNFAGFYPNLNYTSLNLAYRPFSYIELKGGYTWEQTNSQGELDSPTSQKRGAYFGFSFHPNNYLSIILTGHYRQKNWTSKIENPWAEKYAQIDVIKIFNNFNFAAYFHYGRTDFWPEDKKRTLYGLGLSLNGQLAQSSFLALNFRWRNQKYNYFDENDDNKEVSFHFKKMINKLEFVLLYRTLWNQNQKTYFLSQDYLEKIFYRNLSGYFESALSLAFSPKHNLSFKLRYAHGHESPLTKTSRWLALVEYRVAFPFSLGENIEGGQIKGKITSYGMPKKGIKGVKVKLNGFSKITGPQGDFSFVGLPAGDYFLSLEVDSLPTGWVPLTTFPMRLKLNAKEKKTVEILLAQAAELRGKILNFQKKDTSEIKGPQRSPESSSSLESAEMVEIKQENLRLTTQVKEDGSFTFDQLRPGKWVVKYENNLLEINLMPGEKKEITLESKPKERTILIVEKGEINLTQPLGLLALPFFPSSDEYLVQLAAFTVKENAHKFLEIIQPLFSEAKLTCQESNSQTFYKIILTAPDLASAKKLMESVKVHGYEAFLILPTKPTNPKSSSGISDFLTIQIGAFADRTKALTLKKKLEKEYKEVVIETISRSQTLLYRVQIKTTKEEAQKILAKLNQDKIKYWLVN